MNCFEIEVRGVAFRIWAPTLQDALETGRDRWYTRGYPECMSLGGRWVYLVLDTRKRRTRNFTVFSFRSIK